MEWWSDGVMECWSDGVLEQSQFPTINYSVCSVLCQERRYSSGMRPEGLDPSLHYSITPAYPIFALTFTLSLPVSAAIAIFADV